MSKLSLNIEGEALSVASDADLRAAQDDGQWMVVDVSVVGGSTTEDGETISIEETDVVKTGFSSAAEAKLFIQRIRIAQEHLYINVEAIRTRLKVLDEHVSKAQRLSSECAGYAVNSGENNIITSVYNDLEKLHAQLLEQHVLIKKMLFDIGE